MPNILTRWSVKLPIYQIGNMFASAVAHLIDGLTREDVEKAEATWKPFLDEQVKKMEEAGVPKSQWPQHRHWNWHDKYDVAEREYLSHHILGIECQSQLQGLMLVLTSEHPHRPTAEFDPVNPFRYFVGSKTFNERFSRTQETEIFTQICRYCAKMKFEFSSSPRWANSGDTESR